MGSEGENWDELIVFEVDFFDLAIAVSQLSVSMSFVLFESADVDLAAGPLQLSSSLPFSIHELSRVAHSVRIGLYSKTVLYSVAPLTSVTLTFGPFELAFAIKFTILELSDIAITIWIDYCAATILYYTRSWWRFYDFILGGIYSFLFQ